MKTARPYVMRARAESTAETRRRILDATLELFWEKLSLEITLEDVAERADVSVRTVLRHFGSRDRLLDSLEDFARGELAEERAAPVGDVREAVKRLYDHYELRGEAVLRLLAQEFWDDRVQRVTDSGRREHRRWVGEVFAPQLDGLRGAEREQLIDLVVVATDVYTWKLLRLDRKLSRARAEARVMRMIESLLSGSGEQGGERDG